MSDQSTIDQRYMRQAIELAWKGLYTTRCNPRVGCVLVRDGQVIGTGYHVRPGEGHAEVNALARVQGSAAGATAYVTLEPCNHTGKTAPCTRALLDVGVKRVVAAMVDPNPRVSGSGFAALRGGGVDVTTGVLEAEARELNPGFIKRMETGLPYVRVKLAMSLDGRTAMASGESQWITGPAARADVQRLRARSCAVVTGIETVLADNPALTVRADAMGVDADIAREAAREQPLRVVLDSSLRMPEGVKLLSQTGRVLVVTGQDAPQDRQSLLEQRGAEVVRLPVDTGRIRLRALLELLAQRQCNEVMIETGATLAGAAVAEQLVDELVVYMAPTLLGSSGRPLLDLPLENMADQRRLDIDSVTPIGEDWRIIAHPV